MLHALVAAPFIAAVFAAFIGAKDGQSASRFAIFISALIAVAGIVTLGSGAVASTTDPIPWFTLWGTSSTVSWELRADGLSVWLVHLTTVLTPLVILASSAWLGDRMRDFVVAALVMEGAMIGAFLAADLVIFYLFFEAMLLPMVVLISRFGDGMRRFAALQFFIYTMLGSVFMLVAIWYLAAIAGSTRIADLAIILPAGIIDPTAATWCFLGFVLAFAVKTPLVPFHGWQATAYASAPAGASALLAGVMAKVGVYGFLRMVLPLFPQQIDEWSGALIALALIGTVAGALVAMMQTDLKRLLAFASLSHLSLVLVGVFSREQTAIEGVVVQLVGHGLATAALFLVIGALEHRQTKRGIDDFGGLATSSPGHAVLLLMAVLAAAAIPGSVAFVGEFFILLGISQSGPMGLAVAAVAGLSVVFTAVYLLSMVKRVAFGPHRGPVLTGPRPAEAVAVSVLLAASLWLGFQPRLISDAARPVVQAMLADHQVGPVLTDGSAVGHGDQE